MSSTNSAEATYGRPDHMSEIDEAFVEATAPMAESVVDNEDGAETEDESEDEAENEGAEMSREITSLVATKKTTKKLSPLKSMCFFLMAIAAFFIAFGAAGTLLNAIGIGGGKASSAEPIVEQFAPPPLFTADKWLLDAEKDAARTIARKLFAQISSDEAHLIGAGCFASAFGAWTPCDVDGIQSRQRLLDSDISFGGKACPHTLETRECEGRCVNSTENARNSLLPSDLKHTSHALAPNSSAAFLTLTAAAGLAQCAPGIF